MSDATNNKSFDSGLRTLLPLDVLNGDCTRNHKLKSTIPTWSISDKKAKCTRLEFSNYLMRIIIFSQLYISKSATLDIAYNMKIDSLLYMI